MPDQPGHHRLVSYNASNCVERAVNDDPARKRTDRMPPTFSRIFFSKFEEIPRGDRNSISSKLSSEREAGIYLDFSTSISPNLKKYIKFLICWIYNKFDSPSIFSRVV